MERIFEQFKLFLLTEKRASGNTVHAYCTDIKQLIDFLGDLGETTIEVNDLKKFLVYLKDQQMSARSMARKISSLKVFFFLSEPVP